MRFSLGFAMPSLVFDTIRRFSLLWQNLPILYPYRVGRALNALCSFSLISYNGRDNIFSLYPVIHTWTQD